MRNILITGMNGFIGGSLATYLKESFDDIHILKIDINASQAMIADYSRQADFVFHLEELTHTDDELDFEHVNIAFTSKLIQSLRKCDSKAPIVFLSSNQALFRSGYGYSKFAAEQLFLDYYQACHVPICIYRLPLVFGKGDFPDGNSIIATYCYNIAHGLPVENQKQEETLKFVNIGDVIEEFVRALQGIPNMAADSRFAIVPWLYTITRKELVKKITAFAKSRITYRMPSLAGRFDKQLYSTFLSYVDMNNLSYPLKKKENTGGWRFDVLISDEQGQISILRVKQNMTWSRHWHAKKAQKILVVEGKAIIKLENRETHEVVEFSVYGETPTIIDVPPDCIHDIKNIGETEVVTVLWTHQEIIDARPDTFYCEEENI